MPFLDEAYTFGGQRVPFLRAHRPINAELVQLLGTLSRRIVRMLVRRGLLIADPVYPFLDLGSGSSLDHLQAASIQYRIAIGPLDEVQNNPLLARLAGFSLHAATVCEAYQRSSLERLCRYITGTPTGTKRLSMDRRS
jgi:hypothetical protein